MFCENDLNSRLMLAALRNLRTSHKWYALVVWTPQKNHHLMVLLGIFSLFAFGLCPLSLLWLCSWLQQSRRGCRALGMDCSAIMRDITCQGLKVLHGQWTIFSTCENPNIFLPHCWWNQSIRFYLWPFVEIGFQSGGRVRTDFVHLLWMSCAWLDWLSQDRQ